AVGGEKWTCATRASVACAIRNPQRGWEYHRCGAEWSGHSNQWLLQLRSVWPQARYSITTDSCRFKFSHCATTKSRRLILREPLMVRLIELGMLGAVYVAVLAFGGTVPSFL